MKHNRNRVRWAVLGTVLLLVGGFWFSMFSPHGLIAVGDEAPAFKSEDTTGATISLSKFTEKGPVVLVFYPGDFTPVCTAQLCALRDNWDQLKAGGISVLGINPASSGRHADFAQKNRFPFPLLADTDSSITKNYGCSGLFGLVKRTVYIVGMNGKVTWAKRGNPSPQEIFEAVKATKPPAQP